MTNHFSLHGIHFYSRRSTFYLHVLLEVNLEIVLFDLGYNSLILHWEALTFLFSLLSVLFLSWILVWKNIRLEVSLIHLIYNSDNTLFPSFHFTGHHIFFQQSIVLMALCQNNFAASPGDCVRAWGGDVSSRRMSCASFASLPCLPVLFSFLFPPKETGRKSTIRLHLPHRSLFPLLPLAEVRQIK